MARRPTSRDDPDDEDLDDDEDDEEAPPRRRRAPKERPHARPKSSRPRAPVKRWKSSADDEEEDDEESEAADAAGKKPPVFWRARDSLYFEPLVALAIVVLLVVGMYAYTQNWPPIYVVESDSMQHGPNDVLGVINTGDLVLAQKISNSSIVPYVVGWRTGYSTYGEFGDVLLYMPNGASTTPVIHRALLFLTWNGNGTWDAGDLAGLPCGTESNAVYSFPDMLNPCQFNDVTGTLDLFDIGWNPVNVSIDLSSSTLGDHSGYLTMGDNNFVKPCSGASCIGLTDPQEGISQLVEPGWVIGVARGMIPWFGAIKLALEGQSSMVPPQSWEFLGLTIVGLILLALGIHYLLRAEGVEDPRRKEEDEEAEEEREERRQRDEEDDDDRPSRSSRFLSALRPWRRADDEDGDEEAPAPRRSAKTASTTPLKGRRGRPRPHVKRSEKAKRRRPAADEDDDL
jgi:signal peptidase I